MYVNSDKRRKRPQTSFVEALQKSHQENLELLEKIRENLNNHEIIKKLIVNGKDYQEPGELTNEDFNHLVVIGKDGISSMVLGPTSVYNDIMEDSFRDRSRSSETEVQEDLTQEQIKELNTYRQRYGYSTYRLFYFKAMPLMLPSVFRECVSLFFKWMYSTSFLFIHRESFLYFFLSNEINCELVSMELIYAISCLGARISPDHQIRCQADEFYKKARDLVLEPGNIIKESSINKLQTLLCLALYDLGRGELTSCWLLSGMAFRVGLDFGFELEPNDWNVTPSISLHSSSDPITTSQPQNINRQKLFQNYPFDVKQLRSRIYWGSYIVDRLICLVMGRPTTLQLTDVTVPDSQDIGDLTGIDDFIFYDNSSDRQYACRAFNCLKAVIELITLSDDTVRNVFASTIDNGLTRLEILSKYNFKLLNWRDTLAPELFWNKTILRKTAHNELYMGPRYTFFIIILSINRPFVLMIALGSSKRIDIETGNFFIELCDDVIDDLEIVIKALNEQNNLHHIFCPHILFVYGVILGISVLLWRFKISGDYKEKSSISQKLDFFCKFLENCGSIWPFAVKPANIYRKRIQNLWNHLSEKSEENYEDTLGQFEYRKDYNVFGKKYQDWLNEFDIETDYSNIDEIVQSFFNVPTSQQFFSRLDLADALWDEALYTKSRHEGK